MGFANLLIKEGGELSLLSNDGQLFTTASLELANNWSC